MAGDDAPMEALRPRSERRHRFLVALSIRATAAAFVVTMSTGFSHQLTLDTWLAVGGMIAFTTVGALVEDRRPGQAVGRICLVMGGLLVVSALLLLAAVALDSRSNPLAVAASTLLVAVVFNPLRRRVQRVVDRRFHRARYDAEQTVAGLAGTLRDEVDIARLRQDILDVVDRSVEPTGVDLWLRPGSAR